MACLNEKKHRQCGRREPVLILLTLSLERAAGAVIIVAIVVLATGAIVIVAIVGLAAPAINIPPLEGPAGAVIIVAIVIVAIVGLATPVINMPIGPRCLADRKTRAYGQKE